MVTLSNGDFGICCRSKAIGNVSSSTLSDSWNNNNMKRIRLALLNGSRPDECDGCWRHEDIGIDSKRTRNIDPKKSKNIYASFVGIEDKMLPDGTMPELPKVVEFRVNNLCNLKCRMCNPLDSSSWNDWDSVKEIVRTDSPKTVELIEELGLERKPLLDKYNEQFYQDLDTIIPTLSQVEFSGGEPLINPAHYKILNKLLPYAKKIELKYDTNFLDLSFKKVDILSIWRNFKQIKLNISVDGIGEVYDYVRSNGSFTVLANNIEQIKSFSNLSVLVFASAVSIYNIHDVINITKFASTHGAIHHMCKVSFPNFLSCQILPEIERKALIASFEEFLSDIPKLFNNDEHVRYIISQYADLITFLKISQDPKLLHAFYEYDSGLNRTRKTVSLSHLTRIKNV